MKSRRFFHIAFAVLSGLALVVTAAAPASAEPSVTADEVGKASYQGRTIDLGAGWGTAQSCVVRTANRADCYATHEEADRALGYDKATDPLLSPSFDGGASVQAVPACASGWLCLYEHINGGGRRLIFSDEYWMYLDDWGFDSQTSSWRNNQGSSDRGHLSLYNRTTVYNCDANSYASSMGSANDQAYAVWA